MMFNDVCVGASVFLVRSTLVCRFVYFACDIQCLSSM